MSLLFSGGIVFGQFRVDVIEFFVQAEQVALNKERDKAQDEELEKLQRHINHLYKKLG